MRNAILTLLLITGLVTPAQAQGFRPVFKYGKWLLAAGAVGMNYLAAKNHDKADDAFNAIEDRCVVDPRQCDLDASGHYINTENEALFQQTLKYDRRARRWLFGGEAALLGSAAIFVWELTRHTSKPDNIPFEPEIRYLRDATGIGLRLAF